MRVTGLLVVASLSAACAVWLLVTGWRQPRPALDSAIRRLRRSPTAIDRIENSKGRVLDRIGAVLVGTPLVDRHIASSTALRIIGRAPQTHVGYLVVGSLFGLITPTVVVALLTTFGGASLALVVPAGLSLLGAVLVPVAIHSSAINAADEIRVDLRHQLSAFLDMVTMLLAGNTGHEGALEQAAAAGDGLLFRELRRRMREVSTTGNSLVGALALVAEDFDLTELEQVSSATALSAAEGAPVARTLAAKCSTLRSTLAADQEAKARVRNDKVTPPLVGMALLFMALIIYPALNIG